MNEKTVVFLMCDGFEETETITPWDLLIRAGANVKLLSVYGNEYVTGAHGLIVKTDDSLDGYNRDYDMVVLPGGGVGTQKLASSEKVSKLLTKSDKQGKFIAAICAAPSVLGRIGLLNGKKAICFPGFETFLEGAVITNQKVVCDGNYITSIGMGAANEFGLKLIEILFGNDKSQYIMKSVHYN